MFIHNARNMSILRSLVQTVFVIALSIMLLTSAHGGDFSLGTPTVVNSYNTTDSGVDDKPKLAHDGSGNWVAVWTSREDYLSSGTDADIMVSYSADDGATWSNAALLNNFATTDSNPEIHTNISTDGAGNWIVVWTSFENVLSSGTDADIFVSRSIDNGQTWSNAALVNSNATSDSAFDTECSLTTDGNGVWIVTWVSDVSTLGAGTDSDIFFSRSVDNGVSWSAIALLNSYATSDSRPEANPNLAADGAGNWVAVWNSAEDFLGAGIDWDVAVARSDDDGATWSAAAILNSFATTESDPDTNAEISTDGAGTWIATWVSRFDLASAGADSDVFYARSTNNGQTWTAAAFLHDNADTDTGLDSDVSMASDGADNWVATWYTSSYLGSGSDRDILVVNSTDDGLTWSTPIPLNSDALTDTGNEFGPWVVPYGTDKWRFVWQSERDLSGAGTDHDIFTVTTTLGNIPVATDDSGETDEDSVMTALTTPAAASVLSNDTDLDPGETALLTVTGFDNPSTLGAVVNVNLDGTFSYDPTGVPALSALNDGQSSVDTFSYTITDGTFSDSATVTITVHGADEDTTPPEFSELIAVPPVASAGTSVGINFEVSEALIADPDVTVNGNPAALVAKGAIAYTYSYSVLASDPLGPATILITGTDLAFNLGSLSNSDALTVGAQLPVAGWPLIIVLALAGAGAIRRRKR